MTERLSTAVRWLVERWQTAPTLPLGWTLLITGGVVALCYVPQAWRPLRHAVTICHEMGHVIVAWLFGRRVAAIRLHSDTSGVTVSAGKPRGFGMLATLLAGYTAPGALGTAVAWATYAGWGGAALVLCVGLLVVAFWLVQNIFGLFTVTLALTASAIVLAWGSPDIIGYFLTFASVFLTAGGMRGAIDLWRIHRHGDAPTSDAAQAARITPLPQVFWLAFFLAVNGAAAAGTAWLLLLAPR